MLLQTCHHNKALQKLFFVSLFAVFILAGSGKTLYAASEVTYNDLETAASALPYIQYLTNQGVVNGFLDGSFRPWAAVTRAQLVKIMALALDLKLIQADKATFPDVPSQHWAYPYIESAAAAGLINGYPDGTFQPDAVVTRAEQAAMLFSFARYPVADVPLVDLGDLQPGHWAYAAVAAAIDAGLMGPAEGNAFKPNGASSRAGVSRNVALLTTMLPHNQVRVLEATLRPLEGKVTVTGKNGVTQVQGNVKIGIGDRVVTGSGSRAEIEFDDGSGLRLEPLTEVEIVSGLGSAFITADGQPGTAINLLELKLVKGRMVGALATRAPVVAAPPQQTASLIDRVRRGLGLPVLLAATTPVPLDEDWWSQDQPLYLPPGMTQEEWDKQQWWRQPYTKRVRVKVDMPWGVAGIRGTFWQNSVEGGKQSTEVLWGEAEVTSAGKTVPVTTGQHTEVTSAAQAPAPPRKIEIAEAKLWQEVGQWVVQRAVVIEQKAPVKPAPNQQLDTPVAPETAREQTSPPPPAPVPPQTGTQPAPGQPQQPVPGQPQQPAPGGQQQPPPGTGLSDLLQNIGNALKDVGVTVTLPGIEAPIIPPPLPPPTGGGGGGGDDGPPMPTISLEQSPASTEVSFVRLNGTAGPVSQLKTLQVILNGQIVGDIPVESNGSFDHLLYDLDLGVNQIELRATDQLDRVRSINKSVQRSTSYILPQVVIQLATGSISGSAAGPVNLEWRANDQVQGGTVYYPEDGKYLGLLTGVPGQEIAGIPSGLLRWTAVGSEQVLELQPRPFISQLDASNQVSGSVPGGTEGELVEVLWYHQRQPAVLENLPLNAGVVPDARLEVALDQMGNYSADLVAAGIPVQSGDVVAVLYPANEPVRTAVAGPVVTEPQLLYTNQGIAAVLSEGGSQAELQLRDAGDQLIKSLPIQADSAGYVTVAWTDLVETIPQGAKLQLHLDDGTHLETPVLPLWVEFGWQQGKLSMAVEGEPQRPVWVDAEGAEPIKGNTDDAGEIEVTFPVPQVWSWQPEWQPQVRVVQQVGPGLYRGVQVNLGVVPGLELDLEQSTAHWWAGQGLLKAYIPETGQQEIIQGGNTRVALAGKVSLRTDLGLQVGDDQYGLVVPLYAYLTYISGNQEDNLVELLLAGQVDPGQQVLIELGNGSPVNHGLVRTAVTVEEDGGFSHSIPAGWQPDWVRVWAMGPGGYRAYRELYPWSMEVNQDTGWIRGYYRKAGSDLVVSVIPPDAIQPAWEATVQAVNGFYQVQAPGVIPSGSRVRLANDAGVINETVAALRSAYLDLETRVLGSIRLGPPAAVLVGVGNSGSLWSLPGAEGRYNWNYSSTLLLEPAEGQLPGAVMATKVPGGHRFQRQADTLGMQVLMHESRVEALVNTSATTGQLRWQRAGQTIWIGQVVLEPAGGGLDKAVFILPGVLRSGDRLELNSSYSVVLPALSISIDKNSGTVNGNIMAGGQPITGGTVEVAVVTSEKRLKQLLVTGPGGEFTASLPVITGEDSLEVTYITATGHRVTLTWEPGEW